MLHYMSVKFKEKQINFVRCNELVNIPDLVILHVDWLVGETLKG